MMMEQITIDDVFKRSEHEKSEKIYEMQSGELVKITFNELEASEMDKIYVEYYARDVLGKRGRVTGKKKNGVFEIKLENDGRVLYWYGRDLIQI